MSGPSSPTLVGLPPPTGEKSPLGDGGTPIPPPAAPSGLPPLHPGPPPLTKKEKNRIKIEGIAPRHPTGTGRKTRKRKSKSRRRRNGRTYRRS
jgi:hypothetical protein